MFTPSRISLLLMALGALLPTAVAAQSQSGSTPQRVITLSPQLTDKRLRVPLQDLLRGEQKPLQVQAQNPMALVLPQHPNLQVLLQNSYPAPLTVQPVDPAQPQIRNLLFTPEDAARVVVRHPLLTPQDHSVVIQVWLQTHK